MIFMNKVVPVVILLFPLSEIFLSIVKRARGDVTRADRGSMRLLWLAIGLGVGLAIASQWVPSAGMRISELLRQASSLILLLGGLALRWMAILTLGRHFTVQVVIRRDHELVERGLYRVLRHPSYAGLLIAFLGLGIHFANWLSLAALMLPIGAAVLYRIGTEEKALRQAFGASWESYRSRTKRLIPRIY
jgi:protein-S-isoprenylcysteine O-methyltransferase Ste14